MGSVAFFVADSDEDDGGDDEVGSGGVVVGPDLLAFSLALAGSVMITVSVVSIIPEALSIDANIDEGIYASSGSTLNVFGHLISSRLLLQRSVGFAVGWGVYALLSRWLSVLPEQDELWGGLIAGVGDDGTTPLVPAAASNAGIDVADIPADSGVTSSIINSSSRGNNADQPESRQSSMRLTILLFLSLLLHNFPEGLAVAFSAASTMSNPTPPSSSIIETPPVEARTMISPPSTIGVSSGITSFANNLNPSSPLPEVKSSIILPVSPPTSIQTQITASPSSSPSHSLASIVTLGIALHNIPEGIAIAVPCMAARPDRPFLAFGLASLSGLAEPIGAFVGLTVIRFRGGMMQQYGATVDGLDGDNVEATSAFLLNDSNVGDMGNALAFVAGIMIAVSVCELLPEASRQRRECDGPTSFVLGAGVGVGVMVLTELSRWMI